MSADPLAVHVPGEADLNLYAYVRGGLLKNVDPLGFEEKQIGGLDASTFWLHQAIRKEIGRSYVDRQGGIHAGEGGREIVLRLSDAGGGEMDPQAVVTHNTGGTQNTSAEAEVAGMGPGHVFHFAVDREGTVVQGLSVLERGEHVGDIKWRSVEEGGAPAPEGYGNAAHKRELSLQEQARHDYPERYPSNKESIGVEVVARWDGSAYDAMTKEQVQAARWLLGEVRDIFGLQVEDQVPHPTAAFKNPSEGLLGPETAANEHPDAQPDARADRSMASAGEGPE